MIRLTGIFFISQGRRASTADDQQDHGHGAHERDVAHDVGEVVGGDAAAARERGDDAHEGDDPDVAVAAQHLLHFGERELVGAGRLGVVLLGAEDEPAEADDGHRDGDPEHDPGVPGGGFARPGEQDRDEHRGADSAEHREQPGPGGHLGDQAAPEKVRAR
jgi:hypothetical protein